MRTGLVAALIFLSALPAAAQCGVPPEILSLTATPIDSSGHFTITVTIRNAHSYNLTWRDRRRR